MATCGSSAGTAPSQSIVRAAASCGSSSSPDQASTAASVAWNTRATPSNPVFPIALAGRGRSSFFDYARSRSETGASTRLAGAAPADRPLSADMARWHMPSSRSQLVPSSDRRSRMSIRDSPRARKERRQAERIFEGVTVERAVFLPPLACPGAPRDQSVWLRPAHRADRPTGPTILPSSMSYPMKATSAAWPARYRASRVRSRSRRPRCPR